MLRYRCVSLLLSLILACPFLRSAQSDGPDSPAFQEARALFMAQRYPESRVAFEELGESVEPDNPRIHYYLGRIAMKRSDERDAIFHFERATALDPSNSGYFAELGGAYALALDKAPTLKKPALARKVRTALEHAVELDPRCLDAREGLVDYYRQAPSFLGGGISKAFAQAEQIRTYDLERGTRILANLYLRSNDTTQAIETYEALLVTQPDNAFAHYTLGQFAEKVGDKAKARHAYETALSLAPDFAAARLALENL